MVRRRRNPERRPMSACERGVWIDTEGTIEPTHIRIAQEEREPFEDYWKEPKKTAL